MTREPTAIQRALEILNHEKGELRAEVERLNTDNHQLQETLSVAGLWRDLGAENKELRDEVERLRGVLADIKCGAVNITMAKRMAERALEPKS
jgi:predicted nuclease with TOPRIM domain